VTIAEVQSNPEIRFAGLAEPAPILLILAAGLQLGVLPPVRRLQQDNNLPEILHPILFLSTSAPALLLLTRVAEGGSQISSIWFWFILAVLAVIGSGASLISTPGLNAIVEWTAGSGAFVVAAGISQVQSAAMAWGLTCLLAGCFFLQFRNRTFLLRVLAMITLLSLTSLPFTSTWMGATLFSSPEILWIFFLFGQSMLVVVFLRTSRVKDVGADGLDRVLRLIYLIGMAVLPLTWIALSVLPLRSNPDQQNALLQLNTLLPGLVVVGFSLVVMFFLHFWPGASAKIFSLVGDILGLNWLYQILIRLAHMARSLLSLLNFLLEAQAGMIWAFLIIILLLTLIVQIQPGG
jgi:hypothetical protein